MKILFTGGGTGGHIFPIIAIVREIKKIYKKDDLKIFYLGPKDKLASTLLSQEGIKVKTIFSGKIRRYFSFHNFIDLFKIPIGMIQAFYHVFIISPDLVFSKGGYGSVPAVISSWILRTPILLHESDIIPGMANRFLSRFALEIFVSFPKTKYFPPKKIILVGNPIRKEITDGSKQEGREIFELSGEKPVILIIGGSQGSQRINNTILTVLPEMLANFELIHQCGEENFQQIKNEANVVITAELKKYYHLFSFLNEIEMRYVYQVSDLVISRAGAGIIFEIAAAKKPSILIPLSNAAQDHQIRNAYFVAGLKATIVIEEINLTPHFLLEKLNYLLARPNELKNMAENITAFARPKSAKIIAGYIISYLIPKLPS